MISRLVLALIAAALALPLGAQLINESFDGTMPPTGWTVTNNSTTPVGAQSWFAGNPTAFGPKSGAGYAAANFNATASTSTTAVLSVWLISPAVQLQNGQKITLWTRTQLVLGASFPDRLQVRLNSTNTTNVGTTPTSVGDFTNLALDINPTYTGSGYPLAWTQQVITVSGITGTVTGRVALRYFVENGGPSGARSNYIGVDDFVVHSLSANPEIQVSQTGTPVMSGGNVTAGVQGTSQFTMVFTVQNEGAATLNHTVNTTNLVNCTATPALGASTAGASSSALTVQVTPTAFGVFSYRIEIDNDDTTGNEDPYIINVRGVSRGTTMLFYAGDADLVDAVVAGSNFAAPTDAWIYERFVVPAGQTWTVERLMCSVVSDEQDVTQADFEFRTGMAVGTGGTVTNSGTGLNASWIRVSEGVYGFPEYVLILQLPTPVNLVAGTYFVGVRPRGLTRGITFMSTTDGTNGTVAADDFALWHDNGGQFGATPYEQSSDGAGTNYDHSIGIEGTSGTAGGGTLNITTTSLPNGVVGIAYTTTTITAVQTGGLTAPFTWSVGGTVPPGLTVDVSATGLTTTISGTPTTPGTYNFSVTITKGTVSDTQNYTIDIAPAGTLIILTTTLPNGTRLAAYSAPVTATGGTTPYTWSAVGLPAGLTINPSTGTVSGTPTVAGVFNVTVTVTDNVAATDDQLMTFTIATAPPPFGGGGGGGGGGGCVAESASPSWLLALIGLGVLAAYRRRRAA